MRMPCFRCPAAAALPPSCETARCVIETTRYHCPLPAAGQVHLLFVYSGFYGFDHLGEAGMLEALRPLHGCRVTSIASHDSVRTPAAALPWFSQLTSLNFTYEFLTGELRHVCQLPQLRQLVLDGTHMAGSWRQLSALSGLQHLELRHFSVHTPEAGSHTQEFAEALPALVALTHLHLRGLGQPPPTWQQLEGLTRLRHLELEGGALEQAPEHLGALPQLEHLALELDLVEVPHQVSALTNLTGLNLGANSSLCDGWQHLAPLARLRRLDLAGCYLEVVPREVAALTGLTALLLKDACPMGGWEHLRPLRQLQELDLSGAKVEGEALPDALAALTALTCIKLDHLEGLEDWRHLSNLTLLRQISLQH